MEETSLGPAPHGANVAARLRFSWLCEKLEEIEATLPGARMQKNSARRDKMREIFDEVKRQGSGQTTNVFEVLRLLIPEEDKSRRYRLKEVALLESYKSALNAGTTMTSKLEQWKTPGTKSGALRGDMADALSHLLKERCKHSQGLSIQEVNALLDQLNTAQIADAAECARARVTALTSALTRLDFREHKFFIRIILKEMRLGIGAAAILSAYHSSAAALWGECANLEQLCAKCSVAGYVYSGSDLSVFTPACGMLSEPSTIEKAARKLANAEFVVEDKLDGERVMLHLERGAAGRPARLAFWTRNRKDFTRHYEKEMALTVARALKPSVNSCILDGEMMAWDEEAGRHLTLKEGSARCTASAQSPTIFNSYLVFDMLLLNGRNLTGLPLSERKVLLAEHIAPIPHRLELTACEHVSRASVGGNAGGISARLTERLNAAMEAGKEGLMLKRLDQTYTPNSRGWLKIKPDFDEGYFQTIDCLVLAGYYGETVGGRHWKSNGVSHFLVGLRAPLATQSGGSEKPMFTFSRVGTGYDGAELKRMREHLDPIAVKWPEAGGLPDGKSAPPHFCGWKPGGQDRIPAVWYPPEKSLVLELKAYEIVPADIKLWRAQLCLRFPRVVQVRWDKGFADAATVDEVVALHEELKRTGRTLSNAGRGNGSANGSGGEAKPAAKKHKGGEVLGGKLPAAYVDNDYQIEHDLFDEQQVVVFTSQRASEFQMLAATLGATLSVNVTASTRYVVVDPELARAAMPAHRLHARLIACMRAAATHWSSPPAARAQVQGEAHAREALRMALDQKVLELVAAACAHRCKAAAAAPGAAAASSGAANGSAATLRGKRAARVVDFAQLDIVTSAWLERCASARKLVPIEPCDALHMSDASASARDEVMDEWGDRYTEPTSLDELGAAMRLVRRQRLAAAAQADSGKRACSDGIGRAGTRAIALDAELPDVHAILRSCGLDDDEVLRLDPPPGGALRHPRRCVVLVLPEFASGASDSHNPLRGSLACRVVQLQMLGARVVHEPTDAVTTVLLPPDERAAERTARELRGRFGRLQAKGGLVQTIAFVRSSWVDACRRESAWADEDEFCIAAGL